MQLEDTGWPINLLFSRFIRHKCKRFSFSLDNGAAIVEHVGNCAGHMHELSHHHVLWVFAQED